MIHHTEKFYRDRFSRKYNRLFFDAIRMFQRNEDRSTFWLKTMIIQRKLAKRRKRQETENLMIPPILIFSSTNRCNLHCTGCYANKRLGQIQSEIPSERISTLFKEAESLGIGVIMIAGGEPLMRPEILEAAAGQKKIIFPVFTNGTLLDGDKAKFFGNHSHMIPILSIEGNRQFTDDRRGKGVFNMLEHGMDLLHHSKQLYGLSITLTRENFDEVFDPARMFEFHSRGCGLFFLVEYVPQSKADLNRCLSEDQKDKLQSRLEFLRKKIPALFISLPGDEEKYGGCLAAGRGFVHISTDGKVEPCPFAPYSDLNIKDHSLASALQSHFLKKIRQSHYMLKESQGGCTLWENRDWVREQLNGTMARPA